MTVQKIKLIQQSLLLISDYYYYYYIKKMSLLQFLQLGTLVAPLLLMYNLQSALEEQLTSELLPPP